MAGPVSALCWISPLCSEGNGVRGTNSLSVSWSGAEQIAGPKSPTTHCYKSIKHLQLTIQPPASAAEHVNSCDQITAQLTAFTCAPNVPTSKGEILAWLCPLGSRTASRTRLFGRLEGAPCSPKLPVHGRGGVGKGSGGSGTSGCPSSSSPHPVRASGCCGRLCQDLMLGNGICSGSPGVARCVPTWSPHSPKTPVREETAFIFLLRGCGQVLFQAEEGSEGRGAPRGWPCPGWHAGP